MSKMRFYLRERLDSVKVRVETQLHYGKELSKWQKIFISFLILELFWIVLIGSLELSSILAGS
ncbi:MAG: hypothetical protein PVG65_04305, partial [Candidatus Thorarchaeota archaeon]